MPETQFEATADELLSDVFVVVSEVRSSSPEPRYQRRVHLSLTAAQRAARRAQARGCETTIRLCRLEPTETGRGAYVLDEAG